MSTVSKHPWSKVLGERDGIHTDPSKLTNFNKMEKEMNKHPNYWLPLLCLFAHLKYMLSEVGVLRKLSPRSVRSKALLSKAAAQAVKTLAYLSIRRKDCFGYYYEGPIEIIIKLNFSLPSIAIQYISKYDESRSATCFACLRKKVF